ncbi:MAG: RNA pseudouridine synthase [Alphaproteobacteria bacterium]|nr:RNA pseudouridine synthase [Alphaproteobacteria bacterium]
MTPEEIQQRVLYRDGLVLIIDKPAGIPVHSGPKGGENLEQYFTHLCYGWSKPPALAHRLDRDTSGCLVLGRHPKALRKLGRLFSGAGVDKTYWAVTHGHPTSDSGQINLPLTKQSRNKQSWWVTVDQAGGKSSVTDYKVLGKTEKYSWIECYPRTGRTHQIRVHLAAIGCPIVGETIYAGRELDDTTQPVLHLLSRSITLPLSANKPPITTTASPPKHMHDLLRQCGWNPNS